MRVDRVFRDEPGISELITQVRWFEQGSDHQAVAGAQQSAGRTHAGEQPRHRGDDHPGRAIGEPVQGPAAGRGHVKVWRQSAVGIDLVGRARQHMESELLVRQPLQRAEKEANVGDRLLNRGIARHNDHDRPCFGRRRNGEPFRRGRQPGQWAPAAEACA